MESQHTGSTACGCLNKKCEAEPHKVKPTCSSKAPGEIWGGVGETWESGADFEGAPHGWEMLFNGTPICDSCVAANTK